MKRKLAFATMLLLSIMASFAGNGKKSNVPQTSKTFSFELNYVKVIVGENLKVVFTSDPGNEITVAGDAKFVDAIDAKIINGVLSLSVKGLMKFTGTVFVPVRSNLTEIEVRSSSKVYSNGFLNCNHVNVLISDGGFAHLKNRGNMEIKPVDADLEFEKYESIKE